MKKKKADLVALIGRDGAERALARHNRKAGTHADRRTKRQRTRGAQARAAIEAAR